VRQIDWSGALPSTRSPVPACGTAIDFCHNDVYRWSDDQSKVVVAFKTSLRDGCSHCATLCEAEAISFPTLEDIKPRAPRG